METIKIDGMHCNNCSSAVKKALEAVSGISEVSVDLDKKEAAFKNDGVDRKVLENAIDLIGFEIAK